jgi:hypothetical protein
MSYFGLITFSFVHRPVSYVDIIDALLSAGWVSGNGVSKNWIIQYRTEFDSFEHISFSPESKGMAFERLMELEVSGSGFHVDLTWHEQLWTITVRSDPEGVKLFVRIWSRHPELPGFEPYADHNWYMPKLLGPLQRIGCVVDVLEWDESP